MGAVLLGSAFLCGCAARPDGNSAAAQQPAASILVRSSPAAGATVAGRVDRLLLRFNPPARLDEVTVNGPDGLMPMMVTAIGEIDHYSLPLSESGPGRYTVNWKATSRGATYRGSFSFTVK